MTPPAEPKKESKEAKAARVKEWERNTWNAEHVAYDILLPDP